jgi:DNA invertase Pin-like site-specific DNA recombinase
MTRERTTKAAIYARISSDRDGERLGVERQLEDCRQVCERNGWTATEYVDNNLSGSKKNVIRRAYLSMLEDIKNGQIDVVVVWDLDRLTRQPREFEDFVDICEASGMTHDLHTPSGAKSLFELRIRAAVAAEEAKKTSDRSAREKIQRAQSGKPHGGSRAFGFEKDGVTHNPVEAELIREAADRILKGETLNAIRRDWHARDIKTPTGRDRWSVSTLKRSLVSPRVAGLRQYQGEVLEGVRTAWDPIIDRETWEQVCVVLNDPSRYTGPSTGNYPLCGLLWCGLCDKPLKAMPRQGKRSYGCKKDYGTNKDNGACGRIHIRSDKVESYLFDLVLPLADRPDVRDALRADGEDGAEKTRELVLAKATDEKKLDDLVTDYADGLINKQQLRKQSDRLQKRIDGYEAQLTTIRGVTAHSLFGGQVQSKWEDLSLDDKRSILSSIVNRIEVGPAPTPGSNRFDPARLSFDWTKSLTGLRARYAELAERADEPMEEQPYPHWRPRFIESAQMASS